MKKKRPVAIDLFCGAGGMSLGFEQAGFDVAAAVDNDPIHINTYSSNFPDSVPIIADIEKIGAREILSEVGLKKGDVHVLIGGPPCQGFSLIGKRRPDDRRNGCVFQFARMVREMSPLYFVLENVEGMLFGETSEIIRSFVRRVKRAGYDIVEPIRSLDASVYGVPQKRKRVFIIGYMKGAGITSYPKPKPKKCLNENGKVPCVWDAIGDLPNVDDFEELLASDVYDGKLLKTSSDYARIMRGEKRDRGDRSLKRKPSKNGLTGCSRTMHTPKTIHRFSATPSGKSEPISRFYRLAKEGLAPTLRAGTGRLNGSFTAPRPIHPVHPRCITVREAARLHSFPDWFVFHHTKWHGFRQIGNSVPPLLARAMAENLRDMSI